MSESTMTITEHGTKLWKNSSGDLHREDGPAIEYPNGSKHWLINGKTHRIGGPAIEFNNGSKEWFENGQHHRLDGPAIEHVGQNVTWHIHGDYLGRDLKGFWALWERLDEEQRQDVNLHIWLMKLRSN